ncbi:MAG: TolC family protein [Pseudoflavonifractor sp.]|nr:TolC family protein [Alloprevotella sp.]MCM1116216.1 TolC family protein [Pseudoflavonifractor sp.]
MKLTIALTALIMVAATTLHAEMTLNDCLLYARSHAHDNVICRLENEGTALDKRIAAASLMPEIALSSSGNISFGRNIDPETNTYDNKKTLATGFGLHMSLPLFDGLVNVNSLKAARMAHLRQLQSAQVEEDKTSLEVIRAYYNVTYCKALTTQMEEQLQRDTTDLAATIRGEALGLKSGADVAELNAIVAADRYELANQRSLLAKAYLTLRSLMGMPPSSEPLDLIEDEDITADTPALSSEHPKIAEARLGLSHSKLALSMARGAFAPRIYLTAGVSTSFYKMLGSSLDIPSFSRQWKDNMGQYIGLSLSLPLFTGLGNINKVKRAKIDVALSEARLEKAIFEIERERAEARLDLDTATEELSAAIARLEAEQTAYDATRRRYELGSASAIDLYTSGAKLATARANLEGKRIQKIISHIVLGYYLGNKLIQE